MLETVFETVYSVCSGEQSRGGDPGEVEGEADDVPRGVRRRIQVTRTNQLSSLMLVLQRVGLSASKEEIER